jgi:cyclic pyranopterin phosphate synthase
MGTVDISEKPVVKRKAIASGKVFLKKGTLEKIQKKDIKKGDVLAIAEVAAMNAVKQTQFLIPHCHQLLIEKISTGFTFEDDGIRMVCEVAATAKTGVEMEALVGVSMGLCTIWDMVKYLEKDEDGKYPWTRISDIKVEKKEKGEMEKT